MNRNESADILKCVSIFAVVYIHSAFIFHVSENAVMYVSDMCRFAVPVFIFLWAYFLEISIERVGRQRVVLQKRFAGIIYPYLFWTIYYFIITVDWNHFTSRDLITGYWSGYGWPGQYFFIILFQLLPLFFILRSIVVDKLWFKRGGIAGTVLIFTVCAFFLWRFTIVSRIGDRFFIYWVPYVFFGIATARFRWKIFQNIPIGILFFLPGWIALESMLLRKWNCMYSPYVTPTVFIVSISMTSLVHHTIHLGKGSFLQKTVRCVSKNTFGIFCLNPLFVILFKKYLNGMLFTSTQGVSSSILVSLFSTLMVFIASLITVLLMKETPFRVFVSNTN